MKLWFTLLTASLVGGSLFAQVTFPDDGIKDKRAVYTVFQGATVHTAPGRSEVTDVIIFKNRIVHVGPIKDFNLYDNTRIENLTGYHIYPSFIELDSEYGISSGTEKSAASRPNDERSDNRALYWNEAIHPEAKAVAAFEPDEKAAKKALEMGFGLALVHRHDGIARGTSSVVAFGKGRSNEQMVKEEVAAHFSFSKGKSTQRYPTSLMGSVALMRQAFYDANWYLNAGSAERNYSLSALNDQRAMPMIFDAQDRYDIIRMGNVAAEFDLQFVAKGNGDEYQILGQLPENVTALIAPLDFPEPFDVSDPDLSRYIDQAEILHWERAPFNPFYIQQQEIPLILSAGKLTESKAFFKNLHRAVGSGLDPDSAMAALTTTPARITGLQDLIGKIEKDYLANFFISKEDIFRNEAPTIYTHYVMGHAYTIADRNAIPLAATYSINVDDTYHTLKVTGAAPKYKAEIITIKDADTTKTKAEISLQGHEINLHYAHPDGVGYYRLSATSSSRNRIWDGKGYDPFGKYISWSAILTVDKTKPAKKDSASVLDSIPLPPSMHYPLMAYGFDSIPSAETLLIENATLWTNDSAGVITTGSVLIHDGRILAVGKIGDLSKMLKKDQLANLQRYDARGKHVTPGIIDEHSHIAISRGVNEGTQSSTAEVRIKDALDPVDINIFRQLAGGVTTSQLLHGSANAIGGQSALIKLRWGADYDDMLFEEAPGFIKFALGENVKQSNWGDRNTTRYPQTRMGVEQFFYEYFHRAKEYGELKTLANSGETGTKRKQKKEAAKNPFRTDIEMEALLEILRGERFITCHSYVQSEINMLMHVADSMGFTVNTFTHILEGYKVADKMEAHGAAGSTFSDWWAYKYEVKDAIPHNASLMHEMGVLTAINSDDPEMGRRLNQEAAKGMKYGGMSEEDALKMVTLNPAKMLHVDAYVGSLSVGKHADIVIWSGHPLSVYSRAELTFVDGRRYYDRQAAEITRTRDVVDRNRIFNLMEEAKKNGAEAKKPERKEEKHYHCDSED